MQGKPSITIPLAGLLLSFVFLCTPKISAAPTSLQFQFKPKSNCDLEINYTYYDLCYSTLHRQAIWAKHELNEKQIKGRQKRTNNFRADFRVPTPVLEDDYQQTGFDRGHLVPAADMKMDHTSMSETFFMTNMTPQNPSFNSGIWNALEGHLRKEVLALGPAVVITAPLLSSKNMYPQLWSKISIPDFFYKIAYFYKTQTMKAYLIPNAPSNGRKFNDFQVSVRHIENLTEFDFFSELPDDLEQTLESTIH